MKFVLAGMVGVILFMAGFGGGARVNAAWDHDNGCCSFIVDQTVGPEDWGGWW